MSGFKRFCYDTLCSCKYCIFSSCFKSVVCPDTSGNSSSCLPSPTLLLLTLVRLLAFLVLLWCYLGSNIRKTVKAHGGHCWGGTISVTKDAISSQAAHIIEEDGTCLLHTVLTCRFLRTIL